MIGNTFYGTKNAPQQHYYSSVSTTAIVGIPDAEHTFIGFVISNVDGSLTVEDNCFVHNEVTLAPVVSFSGTVNASRNCGIVKKRQSHTRACEFIAIVEGRDVEAYDNEDEQGSAEEFAFSKDLSFTCVGFDAERSDTASCHHAALKGRVHKDAEADQTTDEVESPSSPNNDKSPKKPSIMDRPGSRTAIICVIALLCAAVAAALIALGVMMVKSHRKNRRPRRLRDRTSTRNLQAVWQYT